MEGNLSDCVPVVENHKLVWYTWEDEIILFYEIDLNDLSKNDIKVILNGENNNPSNGESKYAFGDINRNKEINLIQSHCKLPTVFESGCFLTPK